VPELRITKIDEVVVKIEADEEHIIREIKSYFTYKNPNADYIKKQLKLKDIEWDGKIQLFDGRGNRFFIGILPRLLKWAKSKKYTVKSNFQLPKTDFSVLESYDFIQSLNIDKDKRDYQMIGFINAIRKHRCILKSPTASGKSLMIYYIIRKLLQSGMKGVIIVPTVALVEQMFTDFEDYAQNDDDFDVLENCHRIYSGHDKFLRKNVVITTWQSVHDLPKKYFNDFQFVIGDEAHEFTAKSLIKTMRKLSNAKYRIGTTGTVQSAEVHKLVLESLFGPIISLTTTKKLIERDILSQFEIVAMRINHPEVNRKACYRAAYPTEINYLIENDDRNRMLCNLARTLKGNTLMLFRFIKHGKELLDQLGKVLPPEREIYYISGETDVEIREQIRKALEGHSNAVLVASYGTFSRGSNVRNLTNLIFTSPIKSEIKTLQSIGRVLRKHENKTKSYLWDIGDDLSYSSWNNHSLNHFKERIKIYSSEQFNFNIYDFKLPRVNNKKTLSRLTSQ